ncbi:MAG: hypothetical protein QM811_29545 [Pirellulales bacterium]
MFDLPTARDRLLATLASYESCIIALSAGVDSSVVAMAAHVALGDRAIAVTGSSDSLAAGELDEAQALAAQIGIATGRSPPRNSRGPSTCETHRTAVITARPSCIRGWTGFSPRPGSP